jgi:hypothetical protein
VRLAYSQALGNSLLMLLWVNLSAHASINE